MAADVTVAADTGARLQTLVSLAPPTRRLLKAAAQKRKLGQRFQAGSVVSPPPDWCLGRWSPVGLVCGGNVYSVWDRYSGLEMGLEFFSFIWWLHEAGGYCIE